MLFLAFGVRCDDGDRRRRVVATLVICYAFYKLLRVPLPWGVLHEVRVLARHIGMDPLAQAFALVFDPYNDRS